MSKFEELTPVLELPPIAALSSRLGELAARCEAAARCLQAVETGTFTHPDGRTDPLEEVRLTPNQLALLAHLASVCPRELSIDVGFGMGSSATTILSARRSVGKPFEHRVYDPWGLPNRRGKVVESFLAREFGDRFVRVRVASQVGLGQLIAERGQGIAGLVFIDGGHTFEAVMTDFVLSDLLCCVDGHIVLDDARYPAIETLVNYIRANRKNYAVAHLPVENTTVLKKTYQRRLNWYQFRPFAVAMGRDWNPAGGVPGVSFGTGKPRERGCLGPRASRQCPDTRAPKRRPPNRQ